ncbi:hypothetical protein C0991_011857, partial [Blastosporella zonata]
MREMGMLSWTIVGWEGEKGINVQVHVGTGTGTNRQLIYIQHRHDSMAVNMHRHHRTFKETFPSLVHDLKMKMITYLRAMYGIETLAPAGHEAPAALQSRPDLEITQDGEGFPILPSPPKDPSVTQTKDQLESL